MLPIVVTILSQNGNTMDFSLRSNGPRRKSRRGRAPASPQKLRGRRNQNCSRNKCEQFCSARARSPMLITRGAGARAGYSFALRALDKRRARPGAACPRVYPSSNEHRWFPGAMDLRVGVFFAGVACSHVLGNLFILNTGIKPIIQYTQ